MSSRTLAVYLGETLVGNLTQLIDGTNFLAFDEKYVADPQRKTLSLSYKNVLSNFASNTPRPSAGLPPFFSNLLPEGTLRKYLAEKAGVKETQEFKLLATLKDDLPGAVLLKADEHSVFEEVDQESDRPPGPNEPLKFSLAGVQLKFSGDLLHDSKLVIPGNGVGGHWIVKLPSPTFPHVTELEHSMLLLASKIGITVPDFRLIPSAYLENLPSDLPEAYEGDCLISRRFDRTVGGGRIHMEDFAQVFGLRDKYDPAYNYQSIANVLWIEIGLDAVLEFVRRLVHMVVTGNADMHLKNWSLIYPDGRQPKLSPAYDFVSTVAYVGIDQRLAIKMVGCREFKDINIEIFRKFSKIVKLPERPVINTVIETVDAIKEWWPKLREQFVMPDSFKRLIEEHMKETPLFYERNNLMVPAAPVSLRTTWPGVFFDTKIELDENIPAGEILFKNQAGRQIQMKAPRRMVETLVNKQVHQLVAENSDFANQDIEAFVGLSLYDEWRKDTFIRIQSRLVQGGLDEQPLQRPELHLRVTLFPINWRKLEKQKEAKEQTFIVDFELANGEIWSCEGTLLSIENVELHPDGRRTADVRIYKRKAQKLFALPREADNQLGSPHFSIAKSDVEQMIAQQSASSEKPVFSGFVQPWNTNGELSVTVSEDDEEPREFRYKTRLFDNTQDFLQCLKEIGVPKQDLPTLQPGAFNRMVRLSNVDREPLVRWGLLKKLFHIRRH